MGRLGEGQVRKIELEARISRQLWVAVFDSQPYKGFEGEGRLVSTDKGVQPQAPRLSFLRIDQPKQLLPVPGGRKVFVRRA